MRIGIFKPGMSKPGGTETFIKEISKRISKRHEIVLVTDSLEEEIGVEVVEVPMMDRINIYKEWFAVESVSMFSSSILNRVFDDIEADVWSTHYVVENILVSNKVEAPTLFRFPGIKSPNIIWKIMSDFSKTDTYIANSKETERRAKKWLGIECEGVVTPGVDTDLFRPDYPDFFENNRYNILYVGRLDRGKGLPGLVGTFNKIDIDSNLWIVGEGSLRSNLEEEAGEDIIFTGKIPHEELPSLYSSADLLCLPSHHESFGIVVLEAMSCGTPVVASDIRAITSWAVGDFFEKGNYSDMEDKIVSLINNPSRMEKLSKKGRQVAKDYDWDEVSRDMEMYYRETAEE
jgi:glycosyltransferase involved in cell wall biosynthesis